MIRFKWKVERRKSWMLKFILFSFLSLSSFSLSLQHTFSLSSIQDEFFCIHPTLTRIIVFHSKPRFWVIPEGLLSSQFFLPFSSQFLLSQFFLSQFSLFPHSRSSLNYLLSNFSPSFLNYFSSLLSTNYSQKYSNITFLLGSNLHWIRERKKERREKKERERVFIHTFVFRILYWVKGKKRNRKKGWWRNRCVNDEGKGRESELWRERENERERRMREKGRESIEIKKEERSRTLQSHHHEYDDCDTQKMCL